MNRKVLLWLSVAAALAVVVAYQTLGSSAARHAGEVAARADVPTVQPGTDVLAGIGVLPARARRYDYRRSAFGDAWDDNNDAPGGHNGCDTRDDILDRDLVDKTYVWVKRCPNAVATGIPQRWIVVRIHLRLLQPEVAELRYIRDVVAPAFGGSGHLNWMTLNRFLTFL